MTTPTVATVNKELKRLGHKERLFRGKDYFYFGDGDSHMWNEDSVYVVSASQLTLAEWMDEFNRLKANHDLHA